MKIPARHVILTQGKGSAEEAMETAAPTGRAPLHLWFFGTLTLFWNLVGASDYVLTQSKAAFYLSQFTPEQQAYFASFPAWVQGAWAIAVWSSVAGSLLLLFRSRWAVTAFAVSFIAMCLTALHNYVLDDVKLHEIAGPEAIWFSIAIFLAAAAEWVYARWLRQTGVIGGRG